jgi:hypothetical protein
MWEIFGEYYEILLDAISTHIGTQVEVPENIHYPGFYYRRGWPDDDYSYWHTDVYDLPEFKSVLPFIRDGADNIISFTLPLELPYQPCEGIYYNNVLSYYENFYSGNKELSQIISEHKDTKTFWYEENNLYSWRGKMYHNLVPVELSPQKPRLTIQCWCHYHQNRAMLFW